MSVESRYSLGITILEFGVDQCFLCGEPLPDTFVFWHGITGAIGLCEGCADTLAVHLMKDAADVRLRDHQRFQGGL